MKQWKRKRGYVRQGRLVHSHRQRYPKRKAKQMNYETIKYLNKHGGEVGLVGGSVRDLALGIKPKDWDYMVRKIPEDRLLELLNKRGHAIKNDMGVIEFNDALMPHQKKPEEIVLPRKEISTGTGHKEFKIEYDPYLPITADLVRRDYKVNSMFKYATPYGEVIDPQGGMEDIKNKKLSMNNPDERIAEDALRMLRGAQFLSRLDGFDIDTKTKAAIAKNKGLINALYYDEKEKKDKRVVPTERIAEELEKGFGKGQQPEKMYDILMDTGLMDELIPEITVTKGYEQNKYHKYPLDKHVRETISELSKITTNEPKEKRFRLGIAALLHDIGKPVVASTSPKGGRQFLEHAEASEQIARKILPKLGIKENQDKKDILFYVKNHDKFMDANLSDRKIREYISTFGIDKVKDLLLFREADYIAQGKDKSEAKEFITKMTKRVEANAKQVVPPENMAITGKDLRFKYNIPEGKELGDIKRAMQNALILNPSLNNEKDLKQFIPSKYKEE